MNLPHFWTSPKARVISFVQSHKRPLVSSAVVVAVIAIVIAIVAWENGMLSQLHKSSPAATSSQVAPAASADAPTSDPSTALGAPGTTSDSPSDSTGADSTADGAPCVSVRGSCPAMPKTKSEATLYELLQKSPASVKSLGFTLNKTTVDVTMADDSTFRVIASDSLDLNNIRALAIQKNVAFTTTAPVTTTTENPTAGGIALFLVCLVLVGIVINWLRKRQLGTSAPASSARPVAKPAEAPYVGMLKRKPALSVATEEPETSFAMVIGQPRAVNAMKGIARGLKDPERLERIGVKHRKGVLFVGPGGLGKTLLARATAAEAGVPFFSADASTFMDTHVGTGPKAVKQLFAKARAANEPCIVFIDEIDSVGIARSKGSGDSGGAEANRTLTALLTEMDGFTAHPYPIIVLAATNRAEALDPALLRAGRFSRKIKFVFPKQADLLQLYKLYASKLSLAADVDLNVCAKQSVGLPGSSVENICNEAGLELADEGADDDVTITQALMLAAIKTEFLEQVTTSPAKRFNPDENGARLKDVIGQDVAVEDVEDIRRFFADPVAFKSRGSKVPKGVLFVGPPGTGKTHLAEALAGECGVPFFSITGSDFVEQYVGVGAARVRELFEMAKLNAPSIIFIDEIDAVGRKRSMRSDSGDSEREGTLNQLLTEMDGFNSDGDVIVLAATNRVDILDDALLRPGRFDRQAVFYKPDYVARLPLLQLYFADKLLADDVDLDHFAHNTAGFSGAGIAGVANEASLLAARDNVERITAQHIDEAITRVLIGAPRKTRLMSEKEKRNVAVHEAGHAVVYHEASGGEPIARITIMPRGDSGGHVQTMNDDQTMMTDKDILVRIAMALGGRAAQRMILDVTDTGASSDFQQARKLAYQYVAEFGMLDTMQPLTTIEGVERSPEEKRLIEVEVQKVLQQCDDQAKMIIASNRENFDRLVEILMERTTILGPEFAQILAGEEVSPSMTPKPALSLAPPPVAACSSEPCSSAACDHSVGPIRTGKKRFGLPGVNFPDLKLPGIAGAVRGIRLPGRRVVAEDAEKIAAMN